MVEPQESMMSSFQPCPFCGNRDIQILEHRHQYQVFCVKCLVETDWYHDEEDLITHWNNRADMLGLEFHLTVTTDDDFILKTTDLSLPMSVIPDNTVFVIRRSTEAEVRAAVVKLLQTFVPEPDGVHDDKHAPRFKDTIKEFIKMLIKDPLLEFQGYYFAMGLGGNHSLALKHVVPADYIHI